MRSELRIPLSECGIEFIVEDLGPCLKQEMRALSDHCICCFLTNLLLTTWLIVDSTKAVLILSPCRQRSPKLGMNSLLFLI